MCYFCQKEDAAPQQNMSARRALLELLGAAPLWMAGLSAFATMTAPAAGADPKPENVLTPEAALQRLMRGNDRYVAGQTTNRTFQSLRSALTKGQNPYACVLSCADSRVSPEFCFDEDRGDLFVTRLAGNYVSADILASLEYGTAVLKASIIMVLGHTECGAVKAAIKANQENTDFPGHIQTITTDLGGAVRAALKMKGDLLDMATRENIKLNVARLKESTPILRQLVRDKKLQVVGGLYHLDTGKVESIN
jgi:carbonic anhydrase